MITLVRLLALDYLRQLQSDYVRSHLSLSNFLGTLAIIIGLPSFFIACSLQGYRGYSILAIIIAILLGVFWWILRMPSWTIIEKRWTLKILSPDGKSATLTTEAKIRSNQKGLTEYSHRRIGADGIIKNFRFDSNPVPKKDIQILAGEYVIYQRFNPVRRWQTIVSCLSWDYVNTFIQTTESMTYVPDFFTKKFSLEIQFPSVKTPRNLRAYRGLGAETLNLKTPNCSSDGLKVNWEGHNLKPGQYYTIEWDW